jgi:hypothetical protein
MPNARYLLFALVVVVAGCSKSDRHQTYPASGVVRFPDGSPLTGGSVLCESPHGLAARAIIDQNGAFELWTYVEGDGAVAGKHRVAIVPLREEGYDPDSRTRARPAIDRRFWTMDTSGIELEVKPEGDNHFTINVEAPSR